MNWKLLKISTTRLSTDHSCKGWMKLHKQFLRNPDKILWWMDRQREDGEVIPIWWHKNLEIAKLPKKFNMNGRMEGQGDYYMPPFGGIKSKKIITKGNKTNITNWKAFGSCALHFYTIRSIHLWSLNSFGLSFRQI